MDPENSAGEAGKLVSDLDLPTILRIGHILVMNGSEADGDLEYRAPRPWVTSVDLVQGPPRGPGPWSTPVDHP